MNNIIKLEERRRKLRFNLMADIEAGRKEWEQNRPERFSRYGSGFFYGQKVTVHGYDPETGPLSLPATVVDCYEDGSIGLYSPREDVPLYVSDTDEMFGYDLTVANPKQLEVRND